MWKKLFWLLGTLLLATILCQTLLTAVIALGWIYRWVKHQVSKTIFTQSKLAETTTWHTFVSRFPALMPVRDKPYFFRRQIGVSSPKHLLFNKLHWLLHSLWVNLKTGVASILTTWSCTLLPCILWATAWYVGWHISFNKLYEESETGISLGILGMLMFMVAMLYVPAAQARQAFTGDWRSFFQLRFVQAIVCSRSLQYFFLSIGYVISSFFLTLGKAIPVFLPNTNPNLSALTASEALEYLNQYYLLIGVLGFLLVWGLRMAGGCIYAGALVDLWQQSSQPQSAFHPNESHFLQLVDIQYGSTHHSTHVIRKILWLPVSVSYRVIAMTFSLLVWALVSFMPFASQFANYAPVRGFLNQPLVQLPCFRYVPNDLETAAERLPDQVRV
ncbi:hypothetical protein [Acaryochloris marina]|uniref:Uncharacterized protein n=1 Tax=Acaryochloris marina (strain MBIC 11017) TaxID=329726 RepID=A8ZMR2_ACAM1|nr:hypothetical protein [Acaryochloris marina]ABW32473.1 hypothetical protein AM1_C0170 [Acaryochloris marina MBIC11017]